MNEETLERIREAQKQKTGSIPAICKMCGASPIIVVEGRGVCPQCGMEMPLPYDYGKSVKHLKIDKLITCCGECYYFHQTGTRNHCIHPTGILKVEAYCSDLSGWNIPVWCPLPDAGGKDES